jgi:transcriptional regulator with XRE-family HTH domain
MKMIKELRKHKGLTQQELAALSEVDLGTLQKLERGQTNPYNAKYGTLIRIANALKVSVEDLFDELD